MNNGKKEDKEKVSKIVAFRKAIKEKYRYVAGALAAVAAVGIIGGTAHKLSKNNDPVLEGPKNSVEFFDPNYTEDEPTIIDGTENQEPVKDDVIVVKPSQKVESGTKDETGIKPIQAIEAGITNNEPPVDDISITINNEPPVDDISDTINNEPPVDDISDTINNEPPVEDVFITVDETFNEPTVSYSTTGLTNQDVVVTITADEEVQEVEGWDLSEDKKVLTKTYMYNADETVIVTDMDGNEREVPVVITNIDKTFESTRVSYRTLGNGTVKVRIASKEVLQPLKGWRLSKDKKSLIKIYTSNMTETVTIKDLAGNTKNVLVNVTTILGNTNDNNDHNHEYIPPIIGTDPTDEHIHDLRIETTTVGSEDVCTETVEYCVDGDYRKVLGTTSHDLETVVLDDGTVVTSCLNGCGYSYAIGAPIPDHTHEWSEWTVATPAGCETSGVETRTCQDGHTETRDINPLGHAWGEGTVTQAPTETEEGIMSYTCPNCGKTKTEAIPAIGTSIPGHEHEWGAWTVTTPAGCETPGVETRTCQDGHTETRTIDALGHNYQTTENEDGSKTTTCLNGCGYTNTTPAPEQPEEPTEIDMSSLSIDADTFNYDGKSHLPKLSGLPEGVTAHFVFLDEDGNEIEDPTNAGEYKCRIEFDTPEGTIAKPVEIDYTIKPATITCETVEVNQETGEINAVYKGIIDSDVAGISYTVNGQKVENDKVLDEYGLQKVESSIEIAPDKIGNYVFADDSTKTALCEVKRQNTWLDIETVSKEEDGKIIIEVYFANDKLPHEEGLVIPNVELNIYFDKEQLEYTPDDTESIDPIYGSYRRVEGGWEQYINPDFKHLEFDPETGVEKRDATFGAYMGGLEDEDGNPLYDEYDYWDGLPNRVKVGQLTFTRKEGHENDKDIIIELRDAFIGIESGLESEADSEISIGYTTNDSICIINPSKEDVLTTIIQDNDLLDDALLEAANYDENDPDWVEEAQGLKDELQKYIDKGFQFVDEEEELGEELEEEETTTFSTETLSTIQGAIIDGETFNGDETVVSVEEGLGIEETTITTGAAIESLEEGTVATEIIDASIDTGSEQGETETLVESAATEAVVEQEVYDAYEEPVEETTTQYSSEPEEGYSLSLRLY